jgi:VanZ family protein
MITFFKKYMANIYMALGWSVLIGILLTLPGSVLPNEGSFKIPNFDKLVHIGMFGGFVFLWNLYLASRQKPLQKLLRLFFLVFIIGVIYGIGSEYVQKYFIPGRDYDQGDIIADMIGASLAYGISHLVLLEVK